MSEEIRSLSIIFGFVGVLGMVLAAESLFKFVRKHNASLRRTAWKMSFAFVSRKLALANWLQQRGRIFLQPYQRQSLLRSALKALKIFRST